MVEHLPSLACANPGFYPQESKNKNEWMNETPQTQSLKKQKQTNKTRWQPLPVFLALGRMRQENYEFEPGLGSIVSSRLPRATVWGPVQKWKNCVWEQSLAHSPQGPSCDCFSILNSVTILCLVIVLLGIHPNETKTKAQMHSMAFMSKTESTIKRELQHKKFTSLLHRTLASNNKVF